VSKDIWQTSVDYASAPCAVAKIHITLATSVPLFKACPFTTVRISNLVGSCTDLATYTEATSHFGLGSFQKDTGLLVLTVVNTTKAGCEYDITFELTHSAAVKSGVGALIRVLGQPVTHTNAGGVVTATQAASGLAMDSKFGGIQDPMRVDSLSFSTYRIWQTAPFPCASNRLSVTLTTDKTNFHRMCNTTITIQGLSSSLTAAGALQTNWTWTTQGEEATLPAMGQLSDAGDLVVSTHIHAYPRAQLYLSRSIYPIGIYIFGNTFISSCTHFRTSTNLHAPIFLCIYQFTLTAHFSMPFHRDNQIPLTLMNLPQLCLSHHYKILICAIFEITPTDF